MQDYILWFEEVDIKSIERVGGKIANLGELTKAGFPIPPGFAITTEAYREFMTKNNIYDRIHKLLEPLNKDVDNHTLLENICIKIMNEIESGKMPDKIERAIFSAYKELIKKVGVQKVRVAVRSSATTEDMEDASFAGQHESYLNVSRIDEIINKVKKCWASFFTPRAISYRLKHELDYQEISMGVAIQKMVDSKVSGVMFTIHPITSNKDVIVIESVWGVGEGLVSGLCTPDNYLIDKITFEILQKKISSKDIEIVYDEKIQENVSKKVSSAKRTLPCLSEEELIELAKIGKKIEEYYGSPQDIEWAIDANLKFPKNIFILQSRPETVLSRREPLRPKSEVLDSILTNIL